MSLDKDKSTRIANESEFRSALQDLIEHAHGNDITVEGSWTCRQQDQNDPDWEVLISEVRKAGENDRF